MLDVGHARASVTHVIASIMLSFKIRIIDKCRSQCRSQLATLRRKVNIRSA